MICDMLYSCFIFIDGNVNAWRNAKANCGDMTVGIYSKQDMINGVLIPSRYISFYIELEKVC